MPNAQTAISGRWQRIRYGRIPDTDKVIEGLKKNSPTCRRSCHGERGGGCRRNRRSSVALERPPGQPDAAERAAETAQPRTELHMRVVGQDEAIEAVADAIVGAVPGFTDTKRPIGSFISLGRLSVGKTELAKVFSLTIPLQQREQHGADRHVGIPGTPYRVKAC